MSWVKPMPDESEEDIKEMRMKSVMLFDKVFEDVEKQTESHEVAGEVTHVDQVNVDHNEPSDVEID